MEIKPDMLCLVFSDGAPVVEVTTVRPVTRDETYSFGYDSKLVSRVDGWVVTPPVQYKGFAEPDDVIPASHLFPISDPDQSTSKEEGKPVEVYGY